MRIRKGVVAGLLALVSWGAQAQDFSPPAKAAVEQVTADVAASYRAGLARFAADEAASAQPAEIAVARCQFIHNYSDEEYGTYVESAPDDYDACLSDLAKRYPDAPVSVIYRLGHPWTDDLVERAAPVLEKAKHWPAPQRAKLYAVLAVEESDKSGEYALEAVRLGERQVVAQAVAELAKQARYAEAATMLRDAPVESYAWAATERVKAALQFPDRQAALIEAQRHTAKQVHVYPQTLAQAWLRAGKPAEAARALGSVKPFGAENLKLHFAIAMANHDWPAAVATIDVTGDDAIASIQRFGQLAVAAPSTLVSGQMPVVLIMVLMMAVGLALVPGLLLWPVHYRGLARRLKHRMSQAPLQRVTLWHAWYGAALALVIPTILSIFLAPQMLEGINAGDGVLTLMLWSTLLSLVLLLPIMGVFGKRVLVGEAPLWRATWKSIVGYWLVLLVIVFSLNVLFALVGADTSTEQTKMVAALAERAKTPGVVMLTLAVVALIGPIFEELVFRGLLLNGFARHLDFRWANAIQATLFACMHLDLPRFGFYFALGLFGGWLVRRTQSLAPAIALHVLNNALAIGLMIVAT